MNRITDHFAAEKYIGLRLLLLVFGGAIFVLLVALAYAHGLILPRALGSVLIVYVACVALGVLAILRSARAKFNVSAGGLVEFPDDAMCRRYRRRIRRLKFGVAFLAIVLIFGLCETRDAPWPPRLAGVVVNLLFQTGMILSIRRMQKQLRHKATDQSQ